MNAQFRIGQLDIACFSDGEARTSVDFAIGLNRDEAESLVGPTQDGWTFIPVNNFLFRKGDAVILIDAGTGTGNQPTLGHLPENLRKGGVDPACVTHVLLTHLHSDHANGLIDAAGQAVYPCAQILLHEAEHVFWTGATLSGESAKLAASRERNRRNLAPYADRIRIFRDGETWQGCTPVLSPGHTAGHTCWEIDTGGEMLIAWGDTVHFAAIQVPRPEIAVTYDMDADQARRSRLDMLERASRNRMMVAGSHLPAPGIGSIAWTADGYRFQPAI